MSSPDMSLTDLWQLERHQLTRLNKDVLVNCILSSKNGLGEPNLQLQQKLDEITKELADLKNKITSPESIFNRKLLHLQEQIDKQAEVIARQQSFLESIDRRERETRLVVLGVPDEGESLAGETTDEGKLRKIWGELNEPLSIESSRRLGRREPGGRRRPILVTLASKQVRDGILGKTRKLKETGAPYDRVFVKKDVHPVVRNEWKRLREAEVAEKAKPENTGCVIRLDTKERKLYRDEVVIDSWRPAPF